MTKSAQMIYTVPMQMTNQRQETIIPGETLLTVENVARYLQFTPGTVRAMARRGELPAIKVNRQWRFQKEKIEAWLQTHTGVTP